LIIDHSTFFFERENMRAGVEISLRCANFLYIASHTEQKARVLDNKKEKRGMRKQLPLVIAPLSYMMRVTWNDKT